jgi:hypothetical protein
MRNILLAVFGSLATGCMVTAADPADDHATTGGSPGNASSSDPSGVNDEVVADSGTGEQDTTAVPAAYPQSGYGQATFLSQISGNLIWYNRSVRVGGTLWAYDGHCAAVVYTGYDGHGVQVARQQRGYICSSTLGHGFTLDASSVVGGIRKILIDQWGADNTSGSGAFLAGRITCVCEDSAGVPKCTP